eukprot:1587323-Pyramimonas_sp.AAC.1
MGDHNESHICNAQKTERWHYLWRPSQGSYSETTRRVQFSQRGAERTTRLLRTNAIYETSKVQLPGLASAPSTALGSETNGSNS